MASLDRKRAEGAFKDVSEVPSAQHKKYATLVHKLPALISSAGLCQALHFLQSRNEPAGRLFLDHLARQLRRVDPGIHDANALLDRSRKAETLAYLHLSREALACAAWYRRMVQGVLKIEHADADRGNE